MQKHLLDIRQHYLVLKFYYRSVFLLLLVNINGYAQNKQVVPFDRLPYERVNFITYVDVYETVNHLEVSKVDQLIQSRLLFVAPQKVSQGFSKNFYWLRFKVDWSQYSKNLILELDNPHIDEVVLYQKEEKGYTKIGFGGDKGKTFKERSYPNRWYVFPLENRHESTEYFLLIDKQNSSVSFPIWLWNKKQFETTELRQNIFYGVFFGVIFFFGILALVTVILVRKKLFLYYAGYILSMALYLFTALGFSFQFLYPNAENFNNYSRVILSVLIALFLTLFLRRYLEMDKNHSNLSKGYKWINGILIVLSFFWMLLPNVYALYSILLLNVLNILIITIIGIAFYTAFKSLKTNQVNAVVFFIAFSAMMLGVVLYLSIENGFINENIFPLNPILLGTGCEIFVFSIAMLYQLTRIVQSKNHLERQHHTLIANKMVLEQLNLELEKEVHTFKSRTEEEYPIVLFVEPKTILLKSKAVIQFDDITHISSDSHYLEFYLASKESPEIDRNTIKAVLEQLPKDCFVQIHRSHIVNINYVKVIKASEVVLKNGIKIPISRSFKTQMKEFVGGSN